MTTIPCKMNDESDSSVRWIHELRVDGAVAFRTGKCGTDLVADWPGLGRLTCDRDGGSVAFAAEAGAPPRAVEKLRRGQVRGLLRDLAGGLAMHASAVAVNGCAVLFLGSDGAGKSTAAAEMCLQCDARLLADDVTLLEIQADRAQVLPGEGEHWLTRESCRALGLALPSRSPRNKRDFPAARIGRESCPLALTVALRFQPHGAAAIVRKVRGTCAAKQLLEATLRFDVEDTAARRRELEHVTVVYSSAPFVELVRPLRAPGGVATFVMDALRERGES